jgi:dolichyl-diphosphooligosaccharide--protein glycosyltransferase
VGWVSFFRDCHLTLFLFPAGVFICLRKRTELNTFFMLYALLSLAFAGTSANFSPVFFPAAAIFAAFSLTTTLKAFLKYQETPVVTKKRLGKSISKEINVAVIAGITAIIGFFLVYSFSAATHPSVYRPATLFPAMSQSGQQVVLIDDLREAAAWLRENTKADARIASWTGLGHRLSILSRNSVLGSDPHSPKSLDAVAEMLRSDEKAAAAAAAKLGATHVLVTFGGRTGFGDDDLNHAHEILNSGQGLTEDALLTKLSYRGFADVMTHPQAQPGLDLARGQPVAIRPSLSQFEEVFTSDHSLIRIYKVLSTPSALQE